MQPTKIPGPEHEKFYSGKEEEENKDLDKDEEKIQVDEDEEEMPDRMKTW